MNKYKKLNIVMLPTKLKATINSIVTRPSDNRMGIINVLTVDDPQPCIHHHLYIVSDDEVVNVGDWVYNSNSNEIYQFLENHVPYELKIIATTKELLIRNYNPQFTIDKSVIKYYVPKIPMSFIKTYVDDFNKHNIIDNVQVEYEIVNDFGEPYSFDDSDFGVEMEFKLIINKDNTININKMKKIYHYSLSSFAQWSSLDYGYVLANTEKEAKQLAGDYIQEQYDKVNLLLKGIADLGFDRDQIQIKDTDNIKIEECFNFNSNEIYIEKEKPDKKETLGGELGVKNYSLSGIQKYIESFYNDYDQNRTKVRFNFFKALFPECTESLFDVCDGSVSIESLPETWERDFRIADMKSKKRLFKLMFPNVHESVFNMLNNYKETK